MTTEPQSAGLDLERLKRLRAEFYRQPTPGWVSVDNHHASFDSYKQARNQYFGELDRILPLLLSRVEHAEAENAALRKRVIALERYLYAQGLDPLGELVAALDPQPEDK